MFFRVDCAANTSKNRVPTYSYFNVEYAGAIDDCSEVISNFDDYVRCDHGFPGARAAVGFPLVYRLETMIRLGFVISIIAYGVGNVSRMSNKEMGDIGNSLTGPPTPDQAGEMAKLRDHGSLLARIASIGVVIAVACMTLAQYFYQLLPVSNIERSNWTSV